MIERNPMAILQTIDEFIQKLTRVQNPEAVDRLLLDNPEFIIPELFSRYQESFDRTAQNGMILKKIEAMLTQAVTEHWLTLPVEDKDTFLALNGHFLLTNLTYNLIQNSSTVNLETRLHALTLLIQFGVSTYIETQDEVIKHQLLFKAYLLFQSALLRDDDPVLWAMFQNAIGIGFSDADDEDRTRYLEIAIDAFQACLQVYTKDAMPKEWADVQVNMGIAYGDRIQGNPAENLELTLLAFQQALTVYTELGLLQQVASTSNNLGITYGKRIQGVKEQNIELAIAAYLRALQLYDHLNLRRQWASTQNNLGTAYRSRIQGNRAKNLELAIEAYQQALQIRTRAAMPFQWAATLNNLGNSYSDRIEGNRAQNLEVALELFEQILHVYTQDHHPYDWADTQTNVGLTYWERIRGDRPQNLEMAIDCFQQVLTVYSAENFPYDWASAQHNLGMAYGERLLGDRSQNLELALVAYQQALTVRTQKDAPQPWANTQHNLGTIYRQRREGDASQNSELAIQAFKQALTVRTQQNLPLDWAMTQTNLGNALMHRTLGDPLENQESAFDAYKGALDEYLRQGLHLDQGYVQRNLGNAYERRLKGERIQNIHWAIEAYQQALQVYTPDLFPLDCYQIASSLGRLLFQEGQWLAARHTLETAHQALENERQQYYSKSRRWLAQEAASFYQRLVNICLLLNDETGAYNYVLAAKGRSDAELLRTLQSIHQYRQALPALNDAYAPIQELQRQLDERSIELERQAWVQEIQLPQESIAHSQHKTELKNQIVQLRAQLRNAFDALTFRFPMLVSAVYIPGLSNETALDLVRQLKAVCIDYFFDGNHWLAFSVTQKQVRCIQLPAELNRILEQFDQPFSLLKNFQQGRISQEGLLFKTLYQHVIAPLEADIATADRLILSLQGGLHQLPLGALWSTHPTIRLMDRFVLTVVPSLSLLRQLVNLKNPQQPTSVPQKLLSIVYAGDDSTSRSYLHYLHQEANVIAGFFPVKHFLHDTNAQPDQIIDLCNQQVFSVIHFGCHGYFEAQAPEHSHLRVNGILPVQRIANELRLLQAPLVVLGACQTGLIRSTTGGDSTGLTQAFFVAGARSVLASLWPVDDESSQVLFEAFYSKRNQPGVSLAEALQYAQQQIRKFPRWQNPYYWAAYQLSGLSS